jgi:hypothetical protein
MMKSDEIIRASEKDRELAFESWQDSSAVMFTLVGLIAETQMVSESKAWKIISEQWDGEETFGHFQDPDTGAAAYHIEKDGTAAISTDLSDPLTSICFRNVMLHLLYKKATVPYEVRQAFYSDDDSDYGRLDDCDD